ncbi:MAG: DUF4389 domain-containing protein [Gammaproteobacteria bacterium]|nr:DUF4389 domain-containing protein [Gemmatimonadota bacterium]NIR35935.1 DUF4389 domain-containing protein [Actinomycetota bacterium]NIU73793.1 DUF4389 domain-containing protein [Gammaproteobacteria bacterium]NIY08137.1 DUF4389 domain-containing protein [Gemmatimonadota bacterium]
MIEADEAPVAATTYPVMIHVEPATEDRNRVTAAFRFFLALPHVILVGAPIAMVGSLGWSTESGWSWEYGSSGGLLSAVAAVAAVFAWFAIVFTGRHPDGLWKLASYYMRWRVRATVYLTLLRDEYPPFGDGPYPAGLDVSRPAGPRDRLSVAFRFVLAIPHLFVLWVLGIAWAFTTAIAWAAILLTGRYPETLYGFAIGVLAWTARVEGYMLLLRDEYPPFTLRA